MVDLKFILTRHTSTVNGTGPAVMATYRAVRRVVAQRVAAVRGAAMLLANNDNPSHFGQQELVNYLMSALRNIQVSRTLHGPNTTINLLLLLWLCIASLVLLCLTVLPNLSFVACK